MKKVDHCQRWNIKTNQEITFRFVQDTLAFSVKTFNSKQAISNLMFECLPDYNMILRILNEN
jgi:hypothetical protein